ncbi:XdhC family protein [Streptomyces chiangmaiensis]|uniref:XdhC family protein n=1 Tax=Streptomyces chiangmaiensis TaxID=766497 RepID=A0ABU7FJY7_9ACTN|nr:XdhC family protein [Streptomyces chiangmaiensis]MED7824230.1 XdhC family protein [Streptomyces chiangmaiensis]
MHEIAARLTAWHAAGQAFAVASVVGVSGSAPREPGAALAVNAAGEAVGSVSGGCIEGAIYELCQKAICSGRPQLHSFGYSDADAFAVGLSCGGTIEVFVHPVLPATPRSGSGLALGLAAIAKGEPVAVLRVIDAPAEMAGLVGSTLVVGGADREPRLPRRPGRRPGPPQLMPSPALEAAVLAQARAFLCAGRTGQIVLAADGRPCGPSDKLSGSQRGGITFFVESYRSAPRMVVFGAIDFAAAVARIGGFLGYHVTVCDARPVFATPARFPTADEVVVDWPDRYLKAQHRAGRLDGRTAVCVLTHDAKFDIPLLESALRLPLGYVGAMGSRRTHRERLERLREAGLTGAELARLHSPIGLDLGARTPEETAVAVAAEIVAELRGGGCLPLTGTDSPIHHAVRPLA